MRKFRLLTADEIDCRVATIKQDGLSLLLYKDARCDMNILDETVGAMNWQKRYSRDNANCSVGIYNADLKEWIWKEDVGTPSNTEEQKGLASDSFKRACVNWGIGRELYTAPFIWIDASMYNAESKGTRTTTYDRFKVTEIGYDDAGRINHLKIINTKMDNKVVYDDKTIRLGNAKKSAEKQPAEKQTEKQPTKQPAEKRTDVARHEIGKDRANALARELENRGIAPGTIFRLYNVKALENLKEVQLSNIAVHFDDILKKQEESA